MENEQRTHSNMTMNEARRSVLVMRVFSYVFMCVCMQEIRVILWAHLWMEKTYLSAITHNLLLAYGMRDYDGNNAMAFHLVMNACVGERQRQTNMEWTENSRKKRRKYCENRNHHRMSGKYCVCVTLLFGACLHSLSSHIGALAYLPVLPKTSTMVELENREQRECLIAPYVFCSHRR